MSVIEDVAAEYDQDDITRPLCHRLVLYTEWRLLDYDPYREVIDCATGAFHRQVRRISHDR